MALAVVQTAWAAVTTGNCVAALPQLPTPGNLLVAIVKNDAAGVYGGINPVGWVIAKGIVLSFPETGTHLLTISTHIAAVGEPNQVTVVGWAGAYLELQVYEISGAWPDPVKVVDQVGPAATPLAPQVATVSVGAVLDPQADTLVLAAVGVMNPPFAGASWTPGTVAGQVTTLSLMSAALLVPSNTSVNATVAWTSGADYAAGCFVAFRAASTYSPILASYLPTLYAQSTVMKAIQNAQGSQLDILYESLTSVLSQTFVVTADSWGLTLWEQEMGIADGSATLTVAQRRANLLQLMRSQVTPTIAAVTTALQAYGDGDVLVWEDIPNYLVYVLFVNATGTPSNVLALEAGIRRMLPAHLGVTFIFGNLLWSQWDAHDATVGYLWSEVDLLDGGTQGLTWAQHDSWS